MARKVINFIKWCLFEQPTLGRLTLNRAFKKILPKLIMGEILEIGAGEYISHLEYLKGNLP